MLIELEIASPYIYIRMWICHDLQSGWYNRSGVTQTYDKNVWHLMWQCVLPHQFATHFGGHFFVEISLGFR